MASAAAWASAGELADVQGGACGPVSQVPGPAPAAADATRAPARDAEVSATSSRTSIVTSMIPKSIVAMIGRTSAASTATAPRSVRQRRRRVLIGT